MKKITYVLVRSLKLQLGKVNTVANIGYQIGNIIWNTSNKRCIFYSLQSTVQ